MDMHGVAVVVACGGVAIVAVWAWDRWWRWRIKRSVNRELGDTSDTSKTAGASLALVPESHYRVEDLDGWIRCTAPDGACESVSWADLCRVEMLTTGDGPFLPDLYWVLHGSEGGCVIPVGAAGEDQLMAKLQALPGFRNEAIVEAMYLIRNNRLLCWERAA